MSETKIRLSQITTKGGGLKETSEDYSIELSPINETLPIRIGDAPAVLIEAPTAFSERVNIETTTDQVLFLENPNGSVIFYDSTLATTGSIGISLISPLTPASGGTGLDSFTSDAILYAAGTSTLATSANLTYSGGILELGNNGTIATTGLSGQNQSVIESAGAGTGYSRAFLTNSGGGITVGVESSSTDTLYSGTTAYAAVIGGTTGSRLQLGSDSQIRATFDLTGKMGLGTSTPEAFLNANTRCLHINQNTADGSGIRLQSSNTNVEIIAGDNQAILYATTDDRSLKPNQI